MTAEIAVLNKSAVALAADSAVTIGRGASAKIYNSVNKIFELHETAPVGIMVYGSVDFMGLPLETLIKQYRKQLKDKTFLTITEYKRDFVTWLETKVPISKDDEDRAIGFISYDLFGDANNKIEEEIITGIRQQAKYLKSKDNSLAQKIIQSSIDIIRKLDLMAYCSKQYSIEIEEKFGLIIDIMIKNTIN